MSVVHVLPGEEVDDGSELELDGDGVGLLVGPGGEAALWKEETRIIQIPAKAAKEK